MVSYGKQTIEQVDIEEVAAALQDDLLTTGPRVAQFEQEFARYVGSKFAVAVSSGTAALHLACLAAGLSTGDELMTSPMSFAASANCALYCGAKPVFVDIDEQGLIDATKIEEKITSRTKAIVPVHYTGLPCDMPAISALAKKNNLIVIEDACHALGSRSQESKIGSCAFSDMAVFSFHPVKHITTGEGGMITTNSQDFYEKLLMLRTHGLTKDPQKLVNRDEGPWHWEMQELGYNYRLTAFQCALGYRQLQRVDAFIARRRSIAERYQAAFQNILGLRLPSEKPGQFNAYHLYVIRLRDTEHFPIKEARRQLFEHLQQRNIHCQVHYVPIYRHPYYQQLGYEKGLCPRAERFYEGIISLPMYPGLTMEEQDAVIKTVVEFMGENL